MDQQFIPNEITPLELHQMLVSAEYTVCFTGHRRLFGRDDELRTTLDGLLETLYRRGHRVFISGGAMGFDHLAGLSVLDLRKRYPDVKLVMALPCPDQCKGWHTADKLLLSHLICEADKIAVLSDRYTDSCMHERNHFMVDHCCMCIAFSTHQKRSGTYSTMRYAWDQGVPVLNIADPQELSSFMLLGQLPEGKPRKRQPRTWQTRLELPDQPR